MNVLPLLLVMLLAISDACAISINEGMYNPAGEDNNKEFIELLLDTPMNLSGFIIMDRASNDTLVPLRIQQDSVYALIVEEGFNTTSINASIYSAGSSIGNNLDNSGDAVILYAPNGTLLTNVSYDGTLANGNGRSIEFFEGMARESLETGGTPGRENSILAVPVNVSAPDNESEDRGADGNDSNVPAEEVPAEEEPPIECNPRFALSIPKEVYQNSEQIAISFRLNYSGDFIIGYGVEDLFGKIVKQYLNTTNLRTKTYTPRIKERDKVLVIKARLLVDCTDVISQAEKQVIVLNPDATEASASRQAVPAREASSPSDEEEASIERAQEQDEEKPKRTKIDYELLDLPSTIGHDSEFTARLLIDNNQQAHQFEVWSYIYRGPKSYSGEREDNLQRVNIEAGESAIIELQNIVEALPGKYKYKVKIRKDAQSTTTDITKELAVIANASTGGEEALAETQNVSMINPALVSSLDIVRQQPLIEPRKTASRQNPVRAVFESKGERLKEGIPYFLIAVLALIVLVFVWKS